MKLLTAELSQILPKLYEQENTPRDDKTVYAVFMFPASNWLWFVMEGQEEQGLDDWTFFGYVIGFVEEFGYFSLSELEGINMNGLKVERAENFTATIFSEVVPRFRRTLRSY